MGIGDHDTRRPIRGDEQKGTTGSANWDQRVKRGASPLRTRTAATQQEMRRSNCHFSFIVFSLLGPSLRPYLGRCVACELESPMQAFFQDTSAAPGRSGERSPPEESSARLFQRKCVFSQPVRSLQLTSAELLDRRRESSLRDPPDTPWIKMHPEYARTALSRQRRITLAFQTLWWSRSFSYPVLRDLSAEQGPLE